MAFDKSKGFEPKKALEEWKKAKPLMLQDTGISDLLRLLPEAPAPEQLPKYVEIQAKLKSKLTDANVKKEPKAVKCIGSIVDDITAYLKWYKDGRASVIQRMTAVCKATQTCQGILESVPTQPPKLKDAFGNVVKVGTQNKVDLDEFPNSGRSVFPQKIGTAWLQTYTVWGTSVNHLITHLSKTPPPDPKGTEAVELTKACKLNVDRLVQVVGLLKPI